MENTKFNDDAYLGQCHRMMTLILVSAQNDDADLEETPLLTLMLASAVVMAVVTKADLGDKPPSSGRSDEEIVLAGTLSWSVVATLHNGRWNRCVSDARVQ